MMLGMYYYIARQDADGRRSYLTNEGTFIHALIQHADEDEVETIVYLSFELALDEAHMRDALVFKEGSGFGEGLVPV